MELKTKPSISLRIAIIALTGIFLFQCSYSQKNEECDTANERSAYLYGKFYAVGDESYLDSALVCIDEGLKVCDKNENILSLRKLSILSVKRDYAVALKFIGTLNEELYSDLPYYQELLLGRFRAMKAIDEEEFSEKEIQLANCVRLLNDYLSDNRSRVDSLVSLKDFESILGDPLSTAWTQYFYYKSIADSYESVKQELIEMKTTGKANDQYLEYVIENLEADFMEFSGI